MNLEEVKALKKEAEKSILTILSNFEKRTELSVQDVGLNKIQTCMDDRSVVMDVSLKVTLGG